MWDTNSINCYVRAENRWFLKFDKLMLNSNPVEEYVLIIHFYSFIGHDMIYNQRCQYIQWLYVLSSNVWNDTYLISAQSYFHQQRSNDFSFYFLRVYICVHLYPWKCVGTLCKSILTTIFFLRREISFPKKQVEAKFSVSPLTVLHSSTCLEHNLSPQSSFLIFLVLILNTWQGQEAKDVQSYCLTWPLFNFFSFSKRNCMVSNCILWKQTKQNKTIV